MPVCRIVCANCGDLAGAAVTDNYDDCVKFRKRWMPESGPFQKHEYQLEVE